MVPFTRPVRLKPEHREALKEFECGERALDLWLKTKALSNEIAGGSRTLSLFQRKRGNWPANFLCRSIPLSMKNCGQSFDEISQPLCRSSCLAVWPRASDINGMDWESLCLAKQLELPDSLRNQSWLSLSLFTLFRRKPRIFIGNMAFPSPKQKSPCCFSDCIRKRARKSHA